MRISGLMTAILVSSLGVLSACEMDMTGDDPESLNEDEILEEEGAPADEVALSEKGSEIEIAATPTCNWVASYAGAWVPFYTGTNTVNCSMIQGTNSAAVQKLQHSMNICYGESLNPDGDFGGLTRAALIRTQRKAGTAADGEYGPNTRRAMLHQPINGGSCVRVP